MNRTFSFGVLLLVAAVGFGGWVYGPEISSMLTPGSGAATGSKPAGGSSGDRPAGGQQAPIPVEIRPVSIGQVRQQIEAVGSLRSNESVIVRPEIAGRVTEILFEEGQAVKRGMPLVRLDSAIPRAQVNQARAAIALSRANFGRAEELFGKGAGTQRSRDEATAKLAADESSLALAQATLDKSTILAPFDGVLGLRQISIGDYVNPGQVMVNIENIDQLKVDFRIPEVHAPSLSPNMAIRLRLDALPGQNFDGRVYAIDPAFDPNGRAAILRARLPNSDRQLRPGMFARVTLIVEERSNAILVPETALVPVGGDVFVFRAINGKAVQTKIRIGLRRGGEVEVIEGLGRDDLIVAEGGAKLRDGQNIRPPSMKGA